MCGECFGASLAASNDFSVPTLCPFCGSDGQGKMMHVCSIDELNDYLSSRPLTTICQTKHGKHKQKYEYQFCQCGCSYQISIKYLSDG
jgi:hypothetical protein